VAAWVNAFQLGREVEAIYILDSKREASGAGGSVQKLALALTSFSCCILKFFHTLRILLFSISSRSPNRINLTICVLVDVRTT
jgi:hypothetical protein